MSAARGSGGARLRGAFTEEAGRLGRLAGPLVVAQVSQVGMGFTDTVMAGRLGPLDLAAVALGSILWLPPYLVFFGLLNALAPTIAQCKGAGDLGGIGANFRQGLWLAGALALIAAPVILGVRHLMVLADTVPAVADLAGGYLAAVAWGMPAACFFFVARFLTEGIGNTRPVMYINVFGLGVNALGNYAFMFGELGAPALGAVGCGVATALVLWLDMALVLAFVALHPQYRRYRLFAGREPPNPRVIAGYVRLGAPIAFGIMTEVFMFLAVGLLMSSLSAAAMAAHQIAINYAALMFMVPLGVGMAVLIRVGHLVGAGDLEGARFASYVAVSLSGAFMACAALVMFAFPHLIVSLYSDDPAVVELAVHLLFFAAVFQVSDGLNITLVHALRGVKDALVPMLLGILAYWGFGLTLAWYLGIERGLGPSGLWSGLIGGLTLSCLLAFWRLRRVFARLIRASAGRARR